MVHWQAMFRRVLHCVIVFGLVAVAPLPVSACALLAGLPADCQPQPHCEQMDAAAPLTSIESAPGQSCCQLSGAPIPQAQTKVSTPDFAENLPSDVQPVLFSHGSEVFFPATHSDDVSPPDRQPLLCVFLI